MKRTLFALLEWTIYLVIFVLISVSLFFLVSKILNHLDCAWGAGLLFPEPNEDLKCSFLGMRIAEGTLINMLYGGSLVISSTLAIAIAFLFKRFLNRKATPNQVSQKR